MPFTVNIHADVHVHVGPDTATLDRLSAIERGVQALIAQGGVMNEKITQLSQRLDAATNEIAKDLQALRDAIANNTVSEEQLTALDSTITRLEAMGQDPENPVPAPPA